jgi:hypothetical protein
MKEEQKEGNRKRENGIYDQLSESVNVKNLNFVSVGQLKRTLYLS